MVAGENTRDSNGVILEHWIFNFMLVGLILLVVAILVGSMGFVVLLLDASSNRHLSALVSVHCVSARNHREARVVAVETVSLLKGFVDFLDVRSSCKFERLRCVSV
jgi:hypothetical protein